MLQLQTEIRKFLSRLKGKTNTTYQNYFLVTNHTNECNKSSYLEVAFEF